MAFEGRLATVGYVDGVLHGDMDIEALHAKRLTLFGVSNKQRSPAQRAAGLPAFRAEVLPLFANGSLQPLVDKVFPFDQLDAAKTMMEANQHVGKIVLAGA
jgi:NADPH:quinone reductase-like Zn-dependent oxidoreductase